MILAEFDTRHFSWKIFARTVEEADKLMREAWEKHCKDYPGANSYDDLQDMGYFTDPCVTEVKCGQVIRDHDVIHDDLSKEEWLDVTVVSSPADPFVFVARPGTGDIERALLEFVTSEWPYQLDSLEDMPKIDDISEDERVEVFFENADSAVYIEYQERAIVRRLPDALGSRAETAECI